jgi:hypothetical protein
MRNRLAASLVISLCVIALSAVQASAQAPSCAGIRTTADCPDTGCGGPGADALLNQKKNRIEDAASPERVTLSDIRRLRQPSSWRDGVFEPRLGLGHGVDELQPARGRE